MPFERRRFGNRRGGFNRGRGFDRGPREMHKAICSECGTIATTPAEYCIHVTGRTAWGEINVGLKPIEYSLVVQPAEPEAKLLRCIASLNSKQDKLKSLL